VTGDDAAAAMLARVAALAPVIGVTRLAVLTGLDRVGIPVAAAIRPNSRTVAVHQGKGPTLVQAKVSALMEALECFCAETLLAPLRLGTAHEMLALGAVAELARLPRCRGGPDPADRQLLWVEGRCLLSGATIWVPRELVAADFVEPPPPGNGVFQATTNGLGSGDEEPAAVLHALCEVIERDAMALWHRADDWRQAACLLDLASIDGPLAAAMLRRCRAAGVSVAIWDVTSDIGVPTFAALLVDPGGQVQPELGSACRPDADRALAAALAEAAQARLTTISGARDDFLPGSYSPAEVAERAQAASAWIGRPAARRFTAPGGGPAAAEAAIDQMLSCLQNNGMGQVACVRLSRPELGVPVVRVVVPGLEGAWSDAAGEYVPGARALAWAPAA
jgi:ribosomal protein S12 methylthiotransferase accessory factor